MEKEQVMNPNKKELTALECIESLENLFKYYKKDSEFNYQLSVSDSPFNTLKKFLMSKLCDEAVKPSEALKYVIGKIVDLEDDLQHYTMVEKDKCKEFFIREDLKQLATVKQALLKAQEMEKENAELKKKIEYQQYSFDKSKEMIKQFIEQEKVLEIIREKGVILSTLEYSQTVEDYNNAILFSKPSAYEMCKLTQEEFKLLKRYVK